MFPREDVGKKTKKNIVCPSSTPPPQAKPWGTQASKVQFPPPTIFLFSDEFLFSASCTQALLCLFNKSTFLHLRHAHSATEFREWKNILF